jgi:hypothetical protein
VALLATLAVLVGGCDLLATEATPGPATAAPSATAATPGPTPQPTPSPPPTPASPAPWWVPGSAGSGYGALPVPVYPTPNPVAAGRARPTRVAIPSLDIDLPIIAPPKNERWPLCDVAEYLRDFDLPGQDGTTYVYAHAQRGMFLPILRASWRNNGRALIGDTVYVWTADDRRYEYRISQVRRHQRSLTWAFDLPAESLVLQTSENQYASGPKVMLVARFRAVTSTPHVEANPKAKPRRCG